MGENKVTVYQEHGEIAPAILFFFCTFNFMFFGRYAGWFDATACLPLGLIMLCSMPPYIYSFICYIRKGDTINGCVFAVFCMAFAGVGAASNLVEWYGYANGIAIDAGLFNMMWLTSGIFVIPIVVGMRKGPALPFIVFLVSVFELVFMGLVGLGVLPLWFNYIIMGCMLFIGFGGYYCFFSYLFAASGLNLPLGKPIVK